MPLSVYAGSREVMRTCEMPGFSISSTYGGETLSLAACRAVVDVYRKHDVIGHIARLGSMLQSGMNEIFERYSLGLRASGIGACPAIIDLPGTSPETRGAFFRQAFREGVSLYNVVYVNFSHDEAVIRDVLSRLDKAAAEVKA